MPLARILPLALGAAGCLAAGLAVAGTLNVSPVKLALPPDGKPEVLRLQNPGGRPTLVQVEAIAWAEPDQLDAAPRTDELLAVPPVFELAADGSQTIRVALRRPWTAPVERAYRLLITEVPSALDQGGGGLAFAVRLNLPVFVTPPGAAPAPAWSLRRTADGAAELVLANDGRAHLAVSRIELAAAGGGAPLLASELPVYALAGAEQRWPLDRPYDSLPTELRVQAETSQGPAEVVVRRADG
jgi:fimbrial chaperone protein